MFFHGGELSLAQAGGGPDLVRQVQPGRDHEMGQKVSPAMLIKGGAAPVNFSWYRQRIPKKLRLVRTGSVDGSGLFFYFIRCGGKMHCAI
jgi:hypothetical protein